MIRKLVIIGSGGHARVVMDMAERQEFEVIGFIDDNKPEGQLVDGLPVLGGTRDIGRIAAQDLSIGFVAAIGDNFARAEVVRRVSALCPGLVWAAVIDPSAVISRRTEIGEGAMILAGTVINPGVQIGRHVIINNSCSIAHDTEFGAFSSAAPGVLTGGNVSVGELSHLGVGAAVSHGVKIGAHAVIGSGSAVVRDCPDYAVAYGVPAKIIRSREAGEPYL
jgi:sugar O-acyltransferase (sialic acid O-acetyltransferase NeuD family)